MHNYNHLRRAKPWRDLTFTDELQEVVEQTGKLIILDKELSANERMLRECALRLLALKHGGAWNDKPVVGYDGR